MDAQSTNERMVQPPTQEELRAFRQSSVTRQLLELFDAQIHEADRVMQRQRAAYPASDDRNAFLRAEGAKEALVVLRKAIDREGDELALEEFIQKVSPHRVLPHFAPLVAALEAAERGERKQVCLSVPPRHSAWHERLCRPIEMKFKPWQPPMEIDGAPLTETEQAVWQTEYDDLAGTADPPRDRPPDDVQSRAEQADDRVRKHRWSAAP